MAQRSSRAARRRRRKIINLIKLGAIALAIIAVIVVAIVLIVNGAKKNETKTISETGKISESMSAGESAAGENQSGDGQEAEETSEEGEPYVVASATLGATGDILLHNSVLYSAYMGDGVYDFTDMFADVAPYWSSVDYMVANLEVPCGGSQGEKGSQYPTFDAPDSIVEGLKNAGVDMCLTASNHTYDCYDDGVIHTQEVINAQGLDHTGTRLSTDESYLLIKDINGVRFGMVCYTYDTREDIYDDMSLNTIPVDDETAQLVNTFCYSDAGLEELYSSVKADISKMESEGCDVKVFFMHWGTEYVDEPSDFIQGIAQKLSDLGADLIIGGHPHVIQPFDVLTGSGGNTTYCLYSTGNAISGQRKDIMVPEEPRGYTEDGLMATFTFDKWSNGETKLSGIYFLPTWVDLNDGIYTVVPLDEDLDSYDWATWNTDEALASYDRTIGRVGDVYANLRSQLEN